MGFLWTALDESSDRLQEKMFVVAGYLARQDEWTEIERQWMRRLGQESDPEPIRYFSTSECMYLTGEFKRFSDPKRYPKPNGKIAANSVRDDLMGILRASSTMGFALGINLKDYRAIRKSARARKVLLASPYELAYMMTMMVVVGTCEDQMPERSGIETIAFLCDEHDRSGNIKAVYDRLKDNNPESAPWMGTLTYRDNKKSPAIQAADLLAGHCKEFLIKSLEDSCGESLTDKYKSLFGRNVGIVGMDKRSLELVVNANSMIDAKPSIYSTRQMGLFKDLANVRVPKS
ncbi:MAG TPA: DUF3800 domain-containing protein [Terriglobales bacterium]|jgi:hypothetical protein|nr:DUF3800 domain-containing protein [Terriglobales bacterium]